MKPSPRIFREYDIRGVVGDDLTEGVVEAVGRAYATRLVRERAAPVVVVGHDNRPSSPGLADALCRGLNASGARVQRVGEVPTPVLYFAAMELNGDGGVQITGSHNPSEYNGIKMVVDNKAIYGKTIQELRDLIEAEDYAAGSEPTLEVEILDQYVEAIAQRASVEGSVSMVIDCGNGAGSIVAERALRAAGIDVTCIYCESDGTFPNHHPDPTVDSNLRDLIATVVKRDGAFGVGLDGDADRIGAVTEEGTIVRGDHLLLLYALDILESRPGSSIVFDVKCSQALPEMISAAGGSPEMWKTGHSLVKERMRETGAPVAGEMSGHIFFADRYFGFDDAIYAAARLADLVGRSGRTLAELAARIPTYPSTPELRVDCPEERKFEVVADAVEHFKTTHEVIDTDGARILFDDGWALIRASNTQPVIVVRFEARSPGKLRQIRDHVAGYLATAGIRVPELDEPTD
jgi:phosphomannomutase/phosphoglucomutase